MVTLRIFPFKENSHGRAGNRTRDLMISSQRLWPLDHEAGLGQEYRNVQLCSYTRYTATPCCIFTFYSPSLMRIIKYCKMLGKKCNRFDLVCFAIRGKVLLCLLNARLWRCMRWQLPFAFDAKTKWFLRITNLPVYSLRKGPKLLAKVDLRAYRVAKLISLTLQGMEPLISGHPGCCLHVVQSEQQLYFLNK